MKKTPSTSSDRLSALEKALHKKAREHYHLKLYVTGSTQKSLDAIAQVKSICEEELAGQYTLEVIDVHQEPRLAERDQIIALPTLLKTLPVPLRRILGSFSERERVLAVLGVARKGQKA